MNYKLGIDVGSTTVKIAVLDENNEIIFSEYERHYANIKETIAKLAAHAYEQTGDITIQPTITQD